MRVPDDGGAPADGGAKKPMSLADALAGVRERTHVRGRQPNGAEPMSAVTNVRAMPSQAARWRRAVAAAGYRSANAFMCDAADVYADLLEELVLVARAAGIDLRGCAQAACREVVEHIKKQRGGAE